LIVGAESVEEVQKEINKLLERANSPETPSQLPQTREGIKNFWIEQNPEGTWAVVEAFPGGTVRSPFKTKEEAIRRERDIAAEYWWQLKQVPSPQEKFPRQHEALKRLYPYIIAQYHDDGDLTVRELIPIKGRPGFNLGKLYVVTTDGEVLEETQLAVMTLPKTEGDPVRKFCCRICGECAPPDLLEEGKFLERISWLRHHYKEKHPGMWGKMSPGTTTNILPQIVPEGMSHEQIARLIDPNNYPQRTSAMRKIRAFKVVEIHDDGSLTVESADGKLYVVTTTGQVFESRR